MYLVVVGQLYATSHSTRTRTLSEMAELPELFFFSTFEPESIHAYMVDLGPADVADVITFRRSIWALLHDPRRRGRPVVYFTETDSESLSNAAFFFRAYLVIAEGMSPEDAAAPFSRIQPSPFKACHDAPEG